VNDQENTSVNAQLFVLSDGTPQMLYVGKVPQDKCKIVEYPRIGKELRLLPDDDGYVTVYECRCIRTIMVPTPEGIGVNNSVMSLGMSNCAIMLRIKPTMYYWAGQNDGDFDKLVQSIASCERNEQEHRAKAAGLVVARPKLGRLVE